MVEQNLLTIYKNKVSISCYSEFHAFTGNHQTTKELLTVAYCLLTSRRFLACAGRIRAVKFSREKPSSVDATRGCNHSAKTCNRRSAENSCVS